MHFEFLRKATKKKIHIHRNTQNDTYYMHSTLVLHAKWKHEIAIQLNLCLVLWIFLFFFSLIQFMSYWVWLLNFEFDYYLKISIITEQHKKERKNQNDEKSSTTINLSVRLTNSTSEIQKPKNVTKSLRMFVGFYECFCEMFQRIAALRIICAQNQLKVTNEYKSLLMSIIRDTNN